jgi:methionyl-tRNA synthetase
MEQRDLNTYLKKVISFSFDANKYFNDSEPWAVRKVDVQRMNTILFTIIEQIKNISLLLNPIIPIASNKILDKLNIENEDILFKNIFNKKLLNTNLKLKKTEILFKKVEDDN